MNQYSPVCDFLEEAQKAYNGKQDYIRDMWANFELDPESGQDPDFCFSCLSYGSFQRYEWPLIREQKPHKEF